MSTGGARMGWKLRMRPDRRQAGLNCQIHAWAIALRGQGEQKESESAKDARADTPLGH